MMLVAGRGCRLARSTLAISRCSCSNFSALTKDTSTSGGSNSRSATRSGAPRSCEGRVVSTQLAHRKGGHSSTKAEPTDTGDFGAVGEGGLCKGGRDGATATAASAAGTGYRARSRGPIGSAKSGRRMEWLEYQSMLRERTGLLRRVKAQEQAIGTDHGSALPSSVDNCGARASGRWKPTAEPCSTATTDATAAHRGDGDPTGDHSHAVESINLGSSKSARGSWESFRDNQPGSTISGDSVGLSRSKGKKAWKFETAPAPESELLLGKPPQLGGIEKLQSNGRCWETSERGLEAQQQQQQQQHSVDGMPPDSVHVGDGSWGGHFRSLGEESSVLAPGGRGGQAAFLSDSKRLYDHQHSKSGEAWLGRRNFMGSSGSSTESVGDDEADEGEASRATSVSKEEPPASRLEQLFGRPPSVANRRNPAAANRRIPEISSTDSDATKAVPTSPLSPREHNPQEPQTKSVGEGGKPGEGGGNPSPRRRRRGKHSAGMGDAKSRGGAGEREGGDTASHSALPGSAWKNVHARIKLRSLLAGLSGDYGVHEMLGEHYIHEHTRPKLIETFQERVLDDPDTVFPGNSGQDAQRAISKLCYHANFQASAVMKKKPIKARGSFGRMYTFAIPPPSSPESPEKAAKENKRGKFANARAELVESVFIPRLVDLALELFPEELENTRRLENVVDLRDPQEWYPLARLRKRRIIYHGGPTNSGKTYQAIERLKKAGANRGPGDGPAGLFCGPLRLLALEVYEQLNSQGVYCSLMTGQERREVPFATHVSCTIEMANTSNEYEVAVIDEIQMLADEQRGPSWTSAVLGLNCPEIHVCGGMEGAVLVEALAKEMGDDFELKEYQRKTKLVCSEESLHNNYKHVEPGDAVVAFSRKDIFSIKREIESKTNHKCCVIYGSLPQETRAHQARLFNAEGTGYDVLVASDAIGMGLNLNIRRVIFHTVSKRASAGRGTVKLPPTMLKQIGGRAGRHGKGWEFGEVTCLKEADMAYMNHVMNTSLAPIPKAGIFPSVERMQDFSDCLDATEPEAKERRRLAETFAAFAERAKVGDRYFLGTHDQHQVLANALHPVENLILKERYTISMAPVNSKNPLLVRAIVLFARAHAAGLPAFINMQLPQKGVLPKSMQEFQTLCSKHNVLDLYKWMSVRFPAIECFAEKSVAEMQRNELESIITSALKTNISVVGPSEISNHQSFDPRVLKELKTPEGVSGSGGFGRSIPYPGEEDEFEEAEDDAYTLP